MFWKLPSKKTRTTVSYHFLSVPLSAPLVLVHLMTSMRSEVSPVNMNFGYMLTQPTRAPLLFAPSIELCSMEFKWLILSHSIHPSGWWFTLIALLSLWKIALLCTEHSTLNLCTCNMKILDMLLTLCTGKCHWVSDFDHSNCGWFYETTASQVYKSTFVAVCHSRSNFVLSFNLMNDLKFLFNLHWVSWFFDWRRKIMRTLSRSNCWRKWTLLVSECVTSLIISDSLKGHVIVFLLLQLRQNPLCTRVPERLVCYSIHCYINQHYM